MQFDFVGIEDPIPVGTHWEQETVGWIADPSGGPGMPLIASREKLTLRPGFHLAAVKKWRTDSRTTELHFLAAEGEYKSFSVHSFTGLHETDDTWAFGRLGADLVAIKQSSTDSRTTEVHILNHETLYQAFLLQTGTALHTTDNTWAFVMMGSDLTAIKKSSPSSDSTFSQKTEVHILRGDDKYQSFCLQIATALHPTDGTWAFAALGRHLVCIKKSRTESRTTEVHILDATTKYQEFSLRTRTALHETDDTWAFVMQGADLLCIKKSLTESGMTEVHVLRADDRYQSFGLQAATALHEIE